MSHFRHDIARTFGDVLLRHIYHAAGGTGKNTVRIEPKIAAVHLTNNKAPTKNEVGLARDALHALAHQATLRYVVTPTGDPDGAFHIRPRHAEVNA